MILFVLSKMAVTNSLGWNEWVNPDVTSMHSGFKQRLRAFTGPQPDTFRDLIRRSGCYALNQIFVVVLNSIYPGCHALFFSLSVGKKRRTGS